MVIEGFIGNSAAKYAAQAGMTELEWKQATKLEAKDIGWVILFVGVAVGAGIVFLPVQVGLSGVWVYLLAAVVGYPVLYYQQRIYLNVLASAHDSKDFSEAISTYKGENWGFILGILYFFQIAILIFLYSTALNNDSATFLMTFKVTDTLLSTNPLYGLALICFLVSIASRSEVLLMKVSSFMVMTKVVVILLLGIIMVQYWNFANIGGIPEVAHMVKQFIIMLPMIVMSISFCTSISPAVISYRFKTNNNVVAHYKSLRAMNMAYITLVAVVMFFTLSFNFGISHEQAVQAFEANISSLAIAARNIDGMLVKVFGLILNIFAVVTAYFGMYMAFADSCAGLVVNVLQRFMDSERINRKKIRHGISFFCVAICWGIIVLNVPVLHLASLLGPLFGLTNFLMPVYIISTQKSLQHYRNPLMWSVALMGVLLIVAPFLTLS